MSGWRERAKWIQRSFDCPSKAAKAQLQEFLVFANGDSRLDTVTHFCRPGCCPSTEESFQRLLTLAIPLFARGFSVPLLYRFKHYAQAAGYVKCASCAFNLLPRTMQQVQRNAANNADVSSSSHLYGMVQSLLTEDGPDGVSAEHVQSMLDELLDSDLTYSVQNSVRRRLVCEQLGKEGFLQGAILIESIISVLEPGVNALFGRTGKLTRLTALGSSHPEYQDLKEQCQESFLRMILGDFGYDLISRTMTLLEGGLSENLAMGWQLSDNRMRLLFQLVCAVSSDLWRRLVSESLRCPAKVFSLLRCKTLGEFVQLWDNIQQARSLCQTCVDMEFTEPLLAAFGPQPLAQRNPMSQTLVQVEVCELLSHMASFTPLNSDSVEVKHGAVQWAVSNKSVRRVKKPNVAREVSILQSAIRNYTSLHAEVSKMTLPPARVAAAIRRQVGVTSSNQHSKRLEAGSLCPL